MDIKVYFPNLEDIDKIVKLDMEVFKEQGIIDSSIVKKWHNINKYQWLVAKDKQEDVVGYISIWHINETTFKQIIEGELAEVEFSEENIVPFGNNNIYCHICACVVRNEDTRVAIALINKVIKYFKFLKEKNITVKNITTIPVTDKGLKLCTKLGFEKVGKTKPLLDGTIPEVYMLNFEQDSLSHIVSAVKGIFLDNYEYL